MATLKLTPAIGKGIIKAGQKSLVGKSDDKLVQRNVVNNAITQAQQGNKNPSQVNSGTKTNKGQPFYGAYATEKPPKSQLTDKIVEGGNIIKDRLNALDQQKPEIVAPEDVPIKPQVIIQPEPKEPTTISEAVNEQQQTYEEQAKSIQKGSYLEYAETYENIMGKPAPFQTQEEYLAWRANQNKEDLDYLDKQQGYAREIEQIQFQKAKEGIQGAISGTKANMAQGREGATSGTAPMFTSEYTQEMNRNIQQLEVQKASAETERQKALIDLKRAQEAGDMDMVSAIQGKIASIEQDLRQTDSQALQIATQNQQMKLDMLKFEHSAAMDVQANYRANLGFFNDMVQSGNVMSDDQLQSYAKSLNLPLGEVMNYYKGAQYIRDGQAVSLEGGQLTLTGQKLGIEQQQQALDELAYSFDLRRQGIVTQQAEQVNGIMSMVKNGTLTQEEAGQWFMALGIDSQYNPITQTNNRIQTAQALIAEYEAKHQGQPPPEGTMERLQYDKAKLELQIAYEDAKQYSSDIPTEDLKSLFYRNYKSDYGHGVGKAECGEGYNDLTDGPKVGNSWQSKLDTVTKRDNPQIGNGLMLPLRAKTANGGYALTYGHVETVIGVNNVTGDIKTVSWNRDGNGTQTIETYNIADLNAKYGNNWGFNDAKLKSEYQQKLDDMNSQYSGSEVDKVAAGYIAQGISKETAYAQAEKDVLSGGTGGEANIPNQFSWAATMINNTYGDAEGGKAAARKEQQLAEALASGNTNSAKSIVMASLLDGVVSTERTSLQDALNMKQAYSDTLSILDEFNNLGNKHGLTDVIANDAERQLLIERAPEAVELQQRLSMLFNDYRKAVTGAGASTQELDMLAESFPTWNKNLNDTKIMLQTVQDIAKKKLDNQINFASKGAFNDYEDYNNKLRQITGEPEQYDGLTYNENAPENNPNYISSDFDF